MDTNFRTYRRERRNNISPLADFLLWDIHCHLGRRALNCRMDWSGNDLTRFCSEVFAHDHAPDLFVSEARFGLFRLLPILSSFAANDPKIVDIGAGACILSAYLVSNCRGVPPVGPTQSEFAYLPDRQDTLLD